MDIVNLKESDINKENFNKLALLYGYNTTMLRIKGVLGLKDGFTITLTDTGYKIIKPKKKSKAVLKKQAKKARKLKKIKAFDDFYNEKVRYKTLPKSEVWFRSLYNEHYKVKEDEYDVQHRKQYLPDVINYKHKYVIEIDGSIHDLEHIKKKDVKKDAYFKSIGFKVFRVRAYDNESYLNLVKNLFIHREKQSLPTTQFKNWCLTNQIDYDILFK